MSMTINLNMTRRIAEDFDSIIVWEALANNKRGQLYYWQHCHDFEDPEDQVVERKALFEAAIAYARYREKTDAYPPLVDLQNNCETICEFRIDDLDGIVFDDPATAAA